VLGLPRRGFQRATFGACVPEEALSQWLFISVRAQRLLIPHITLNALYSVQNSMSRSAWDYSHRSYDRFSINYHNLRGQHLKVVHSLQQRGTLHFLYIVFAPPGENDVQKEEVPLCRRLKTRPRNSIQLTTWRFSGRIGRIYGSGTVAFQDHEATE
jgi:hypothetical protein